MDTRSNTEGASAHLQPGNLDPLPSRRRGLAEAPAVFVLSTEARCGQQGFREAGKAGSGEGLAWCVSRSMRRWERPPPAVVVVPENSPEGPALRGQDPPLAVDTPPPVLPAFPLGRLEGAGRPGRTVSKG